MEEIRNTALLRRPVATAVGVLMPFVVLLGGCTNDDEPSGGTTPPTGTTVEPSPGAPGSPGATSTAAGPVTADEAGKIATDAYGGTVKNVESDTYSGAPVWEVEVKDSDQGRIEVKVAKDTGEILNVEHED